MLARWFQQLRFASEGRSPHWHKVRTEFIDQFPSCAVCGGAANLDVHHIKPFHLHPKLELDKDNLLTLCRKSEVLGGCDCHLVFGHGGSWQSFIPRVIENAVLLLPQIQEARSM